MDETWRIYSDAGVRNSLLVHFLAEEGVRVEWEPPDEYRGVEWASDAQQVVSLLVATGTAAAVKAAVERFRQRYKNAHVTAEAEEAKHTDAPAPRSVTPPVTGDRGVEATEHHGPEGDLG
jgi:hypothetical protein